MSHLNNNLIYFTAANDDLKEEKTYKKLAFHWELFHIHVTGLLQLDFVVCA